MTELRGKKVLLIAPRFFSYEQEIRNELQRRGAKVDFVPDRPFDSPLMKAITRFRRQWIISTADRFYQNALENLGRTSYDLILIINGQTVSSTILAELRRAFPTAKRVLYMWDSMQNRPHAVAGLTYFDQCFTFDPQCAQRYGMRFRPLFFSPAFEGCLTESFNHHVSFVGTAHTDRYAVVHAVSQILEPRFQCYWYLYLQAPWVYWTYCAINPAFRDSSISEFRFSALDKNEVRNIFFGSQAILDIEHPLQTGLTMRTFETIGAQKKLITTNRQIAEYDFFSDNICIIDRLKPDINPEFMEQPYRPLSPHTYQKYSLKGWMDELLSQ
jgi:hypothetical protein